MCTNIRDLSMDGAKMLCLPLHRILRQFHSHRILPKIYLNLFFPLSRFIPSALGTKGLPSVLS
jgi:hypothetical protein